MPCDVLRIRDEGNDPVHEIRTEYVEGTFGFEKYQCPFGYRFCSYENGQCRYHEDTWIAFGAYWHRHDHRHNKQRHNAMDPDNYEKCDGSNPCQNEWSTPNGNNDQVDSGFWFSWTYRKKTCPLGDCELKCHHHQFWESSKTYSTPKVCCGTTALSVFISLYISLSLSLFTDHFGQILL